LGFAHKKNDNADLSQLHPSWSNIPSPRDINPPDLLAGSPLLAGDFGREPSSPEDDRSESTSLMSSISLGELYWVFVMQKMFKRCF